jgi:hypothetical protein
VSADASHRRTNLQQSIAEIDAPVGDSARGNLFFVLMTIDAGLHIRPRDHIHSHRAATRPLKTPLKELPK